MSKKQSKSNTQPPAHVQQLKQALERKKGVQQGNRNQPQQPILQANSDKAWTLKPNKRVEEMFAKNGIHSQAQLEQFVAHEKQRLSDAWYAICARWFDIDQVPHERQYWDEFQYNYLIVVGMLALFFSYLPAYSALFMPFVLLLIISRAEYGVSDIQKQYRAILANKEWVANQVEMAKAFAQEKRLQGNQNK